jgi:hypothetical protein
MNYPKYAKIEDRIYPINTDFKVAIKCNEVAQDETIGDSERGLAIIYLLFGEKGLKSDDKKELLEKAKKYLSCGQELEHSNEKPDMDYIEDYALIKTSFRSDYGIKLDEEKLHWWEFNELMNGLSNSDMGNCCVLNRVRNLRNYDLKDISDPKERQKIRKAQEQVALKKYKPKKKQPTEEQRKSAERFYQSFIRR